MEVYDGGEGEGGCEALMRDICAVWGGVMRMGDMGYFFSALDITLSAL